MPDAVTDLSPASCSRPRQTWYACLAGLLSKRR
jgi:hypothetical protein